MKKLNPTINYTVAIPKFAGAMAVIISCLTVIGWLCHISFLKSLVPFFGNMKFSTAFCFGLAGISLYILSGSAYVKKRLAITSSICAWLILVIGILSVSQYLINGNHFLNTFFPIQKSFDTGPPLLQCMGVIESWNFILLATVLLSYNKIKYQWIIQILLVCVIPGSALIILNHLFGESFLNSISFSAPVALHTGILFAIISMGIFFSPKLDFFKLSFVNKIAVVLVLIFMFRSMIFFAINKNNRDAAEVSRIEERAHKAMAIGDGIKLTLAEMQNVTLGNIISGNEGDPNYFERNKIAVNNAIDSLESLTENSAEKSLKIDSLKKQFAIYAGLQISLVKISRNEGISAARTSISDGKGNLVLGRLSALISNVEHLENKTLTKLKSSNLRSIRNSSKVLTLFQVLAFFFFLVALIMIYYNSKYRNKVEEALQNSLKEISDYKYALDESSIIAITDQHGIIKQVNDNFCAITKYERQELIGRDHNLLKSGHHSKEFIRDLWITVNNGEVWRGEVKNKAKDGSFFWLDTTIVPFMDKRGKPYQYVAIRSNITKRKDLEEEIRAFNVDLQKTVEEKSKEVIAKDQQYRFLLQNMKEGIQVIGFDWKYIFVNNAALEQSNSISEQLIGHTITDVHPGIENTELFKVLSSCMTDRKSKTMEQEFIFPDRIKRFFELRVQAVPEGLFILSMDISDRKKTEEKLRESLERYELVNKATQDTIWEWDAYTDRVTINNSFTGLYGYTKASIKNNRNLLFKNIHPNDVEKITGNIKNCIADHRSFWYDEFRFRAADGTYKFVYLKAFVQYNAKGSPERMVGAMTDFTEKKILEKELVEQKTKQQKLLMEVAIQSQEKEKNNLGKELHDNINQILSTVKMYLVMISRGENRPEDNLIGKSHEYVLLAIDELRKLSHSLVAPSLGDISLEEALLRLAKDANLANNFHVNFSVEESYKKHVPDKEVELMLYRVIQEQLNNIIKYANAKNIQISIATTTSDMILQVVDDGIGFDISKKTSGIGLKNINNRVTFYNGTMNIHSSETGGCRLEITIPLNACYQLKKSFIQEELAEVHKN